MLFKLIPCHNVPIADKTDILFLACHAYKQARACHVTTADEYTVWRQLLEDMTFTCSFRTQLHEVVVVLDMREKTGESYKFLPSVHFIGIQSYGVHQEINPFLSGETTALTDIVLQVNVTDLDRFQSLDLPSDLYILSRYVTNGDDTPYSVAGKQFRILGDILCADGDPRQTEVSECRLIFVVLFVESYSHLVNDSVATVLSDFTLYNLGIGTVHIVVTDNFLYLLDTHLNGLLVIAGTVLSQQIFKHIGWHRQTSLYEKSQILSDYFSKKGAHYFFL